MAMDVGSEQNKNAWVHFRFSDSKTFKGVVLQPAVGEDVSVKSFRVIIGGDGLLKDPSDGVGAFQDGTKGIEDDRVFEWPQDSKKKEIFLFQESWGGSHMWIQVRELHGSSPANLQAQLVELAGDQAVVHSKWYVGSNGASCDTVCSEAWRHYEDAPLNAVCDVLGMRSVALGESTTSSDSMSLLNEDSHGGEADGHSPKSVFIDFVRKEVQGLRPGECEDDAQIFGKPDTLQKLKVMPYVENTDATRVDYQCHISLKHARAARLHAKEPNPDQSKCDSKKQSVFCLIFSTSQITLRSFARAKHLGVVHMRQAHRASLRRFDKLCLTTALPSPVTHYRSSSPIRFLDPTRYSHLCVASRSRISCSLGSLWSSVPLPGPA